MNKSIILFGMILLLFPACKDVVVKSIADSGKDTIINDSIDIDSIIVPVLTSEQHEQARQAKILINHIKVIDNHYVLKISEEDALKAGVSREVYKELLQSIATANMTTDECIKEGIDMTVTVNGD